MLAGCLVCAQAASSSSKVTDGASKPAVSTSSNPLIPDALFVEWDKIKPEHVGPAVKQVLEEEGAALDLLEADLAAAGKAVTYERLFRPYAQIRYRLDNTYGLMDHLQVRTFCSCQQAHGVALSGSMSASCSSAEQCTRYRPIHRPCQLSKTCQITPAGGCQPQQLHVPDGWA